MLPKALFLKGFLLFSYYNIHLDSRLSARIAGISVGIFVLDSYLRQYKKVLVMGKLTAVAVKAAKTMTDESKKLSDGGGLYLLVKPKGGRYWRYDYLKS